VIALTNQKGGVGKTTATANLGVLLHQVGTRVLLVDLDPQGSLTRSMGHLPDTLQFTVFDAILALKTANALNGMTVASGVTGVNSIKGVTGVIGVDGREQDAAEILSKLILRTRAGPDLAPNNILASEIDRALYGEINWGTILGRVLVPVKRSYDYILLDCPPSFNSLTMNALNSADWVVVPTQFEMLSVDGLRQLLARVQEARMEANPKLRIAGIIAMMVQRANSNREVAQVSGQGLANWSVGAGVFQTVIKRSTLYGSVANRRQVLVDTHPASEHACAYRLLLAELLRVIGGPGARHIPLLESEHFRVQAVEVAEVGNS
jgi:chromosome partitioning protein